jgi:hypothetical protein
MKKFLILLAAVAGIAFVAPQPAQAGPRVAVTVGVPLPPVPVPVVRRGPVFVGPGPFCRAPIRRFYGPRRVVVRGGVYPGRRYLGPRRCRW